MTTEELIAEHQRVRSQSRWVWRLGPLLIIGLLVGNVYAMVDRVEQFDTEAFSGHLEEEARKAWPSLEYRLKAVGDKLAPKLEASILDESERISVRLEENIAKELETFKRQGEEILMEEMQKALAAEKAENHRLISKHIPELKNDEQARERVIAHVNAAAAAWGNEQFRKLFSEHVAALESIRKTLDANYVAEGSGVGQASPDELVLIWLELFEVTVADDSTILGDEKAPAKKGGE